MTGDGTWLTIDETAAVLKCSKAFVYRELGRKNLRGTKLSGPGWRIAPADIETYMSSQANVTAVRRRAS
jgi:excisionase family DNA binding protein